jgi:hypothetical protein
MEVNVFKRIFCRYSSTIFGIAESKLRVCCMLGKVAELTAELIAAVAEMLKSVVLSWALIL